MRLDRAQIVAAKKILGKLRLEHEAAP